VEAAEHYIGSHDHVLSSPPKTDCPLFEKRPISVFLSKANIKEKINHLRERRASAHHVRKSDSDSLNASFEHGLSQLGSELIAPCF